MGLLFKIKHVNKEKLPKVFQRYYLQPPVKLKNFPDHIGETCVIVPSSVIDSDKGDFCNPKLKKVDEIHHCKTLGLIENKTSNYSSSQLEEKFREHKSYIEKKYIKFPECRVGYCVLRAERFSEKMQKEFGVNKNSEIFLSHHPKKKLFKVGDCKVFFVKRN